MAQWRRNCGFHRLAEVTRLLGIPKSLIGGWAAEFGRRDQYLVAAAQRFEQRLQEWAARF